MIVASTMVPVPTFMPLACSNSPTLENSAAPSFFSSSRCLNFNSVVPSGTRSRPRSIPTKRRSDVLSSSASSHAWSARLNQCCTKYIRSIYGSGTGGRPLPAFG